LSAYRKGRLTKPSRRVHVRAGSCSCSVKSKAWHGAVQSDIWHKNPSHIYDAQTDRKKPYT